MFTRLSEFFFRPSRKTLEFQINDLTYKLLVAELQIRTMREERDRIIKELAELNESVFVKKQAGG